MTIEECRMVVVASLRQFYDKIKIDRIPQIFNLQSIKLPCRKTAVDNKFSAGYIG